MGTTAKFKFVCKTMWELPQNLSLSVKQCGNYYKSRFYEPILKLWELPQNLSLSVKQCGNYHKSRFYEPILKLWELILLEKFFLSRTHVKIGFKF